MPVTHEIWLKTDLKRPITVQPLRGLLFSADNQGDKVGFEVYEDGTPVTLSGVITGYIIKNNGETVVVSGSFDGNRAWIVCPANAYDAIGPVYIAIKNRASTATTAQTTTLGMCTTYVERTATGEIVTPTYKIVDAATIANMITQMETATNAATAAASSANTAAAAANTAAGRTENMDATATTLAPGSAATANVSTVSGHYRIAIGVPKGDIGPVAEITGTPTSTYQVGDDGTSIPTGTWLDNIPVVPQGSFLWTRTVITWNNGQSTTIYSPSRQGRDGSGSVSSVNNVSPDNNGNVALPIDDAPTAGSDNPVKSGALETIISGMKSDVSDFYSDGTTVQTVSDLATAIKAKAAGTRIVYRLAPDVVKALAQSNTTLYGTAIVYKASANNAYFLAFNRDTAGYGNLSLESDTVTISNRLTQNAYKPGEQYTTSSDMMVCGHVTSGTTAIQLGMWLPKSLENISSISVTNLVGAIRGNSGYVNNWGASTNILTQSGITVDATKTFPNGIRLHIESTSEYTNVTNNTPVAFSGKITLSFS